MIIFLGYGLKKGTINVNFERIKCFLQLPEPSNRLQLRHFLNSSAYFRGNIADFSYHSSCLYDLVTETGHSKNNDTESLLKTWRPKLKITFLFKTLIMNGIFTYSQMLTHKVYHSYFFNWTEQRLVWQRKEI